MLTLEENNGSDDPRRLQGRQVGHKNFHQPRALQSPGRTGNIPSTSGCLEASQQPHRSLVSGLVSLQ